LRLLKLKIGTMLEVRLFWIIEPLEPVVQKDKHAKI
jgi:hypothetical protein